MAVYAQSWQALVHLLKTGARTGFVELDHMSNEELEDVQKEFARVKEKYAPLVDDDIAHIERELRGRPELATHSSFFFIGPIKDKASHAIRNNLRS